nr:PAS domain-containing protein [Acidobacteriota bacterium]
ESHRDEAERAVAAALTGQVGRFRGPCRTCEGTLKAWDVVTTGIRDDDGRTRRVLVISRDITESMALSDARDALLLREQEARRAAEEAMHARNACLLHVAHELRGPLNAVQGWAILLRMGHYTPVELPVALDAINDNAQRQAVMLDQMFDAARYQEGARITPVPHAVRRIVQAAVDTVLPAARAKRIALRVEHQTTASALADDGAIQQALTNVLFNAVKFTPTGGAIDIRSGLEDDRVIIEVADSGEGIAPEFMPRLFEPFEQGASASQAGRSGLGLGLSIVRAIMTAHEGTVSVASAGTGQGATFTLNLPAAHV